jgi:C4-dicarboxylate transporter DctM subunit
MTISAILLILVLIVLMFLGLPITWALGAACISAIAFDPTLSFTVLAQRIFTGSDNFAMLAIPAFFLAGDIMAKGGLSKRLVAFADSFVGWISGGISLVSIVACTFFAAISGSSVATTAAIGGIMYPEMVKRGYPKDYSAAVQAIGGTLGIVIPPSTVFVIYGNITGTSVAKLLMAGIIPGVFTGIMLCIYAYYKAKKSNFPKEESFSFKRFIMSFADAIWALIMPLIILGGIYAGIFTPTESAVIAVFYGFLVCIAIYREITNKEIWDIIKDTAVSTANLMFLVVTAQMFGYLITYYRIPVYVTEAFMAVASNQAVFMVLIIILLTICGMFLEVGATNLILGPILAPIAVSFGVDPIHFGMVFVFLLAMGQATPPFGTTMFVACGISNEPVSRVSKNLIPFVVVELICAIIFAFVPIMSTFLPNLVSGM